MAPGPPYSRLLVAASPFATSAGTPVPRCFPWQTSFPGAGRNECLGKGAPPSLAYDRRCSNCRRPLGAGTAPSIGDTENLPGRRLASGACHATAAISLGFLPPTID